MNGAKKMTKRQKRWWRVGGVLLAACVFGWLLGCGNSSNNSSGSTFASGSLHQEGNTLTVLLESDPSSGYSWHPQVSGSGLELTSSTLKTSTNEEDNAPAEQEYVFTGSSEGSQVITLTYARPQEASAEDKEVTIGVTTNASGTILSAEAAEVSGAEVSESDATNQAAENAASANPEQSPDAQNAANAGSGTDANVPVGVSGDSSKEGEELQEDAQAINNAQANGDSGASE